MKLKIYKITNQFMTKNNIIKTLITIFLWIQFFVYSCVFAVDNILLNGRIVDSSGQGISWKVIRITINNKIKYSVSDDKGNFSVSILRGSENESVTLNIDDNEAILNKIPTDQAIVLGYDTFANKIVSTNLTEIEFNLKKQPKSDSYVSTLMHGFIIFNFSLFSIGWFIFFRFILWDKKKTEYSPYQEKT